jgi:hypothetical protein
MIQPLADAGMAMALTSGSFKPNSASRQRHLIVIEAQ